MKSNIVCVFASVALAAAAVGGEEIRPGVFRTPDDRFQNLPGFAFEPHYQEIEGYRVHYLDEGPRDGEAILLIHGEPTWAYLFRKMIPVLTAAGHRVIVPDLVGFGRSDKPAEMEVHTYEFHVDVMKQLVEALDLRGVTFFGQDWGGLIGLRVVAESADRFARVVISNTALPTGEDQLSEAFMNWKGVNQGMIDRGDIPTGMMLARNSGDPAVQAAYDAPFPDPRYKAGPLIMPQRVPVTLDDPAREANLAAWEVFKKWDKPFLTAFGDSDPVTGGQDAKFQREIPGAQDQEHLIVEGAGHFIQESHGAQLARIIVDFIAANPAQGR